MTGMARRTGAALDGVDHIRQSVADILSTPIGTRVGRRDYGSEIPNLVDQPRTPVNILRLFAATAMALARWENRLAVRRVAIAAGETPSSASILIEADRTDRAAPPAGTLTRIVLPL
ncbi:GPW/gp25 family protein [Sphingobium sp. AN558]|uniref:GPW/gp25 family protein n=1 Tax=Sphingobium sp. AN558 TaxID=3133442 RepID=UPI0030BA653F